MSPTTSPTSSAPANEPSLGAAASCSFCLEPVAGDALYPGFGSYICAGCAAEAGRALESGAGADRWAGIDLLAGLARSLEASRQAERELVAWVGRTRDARLSWARIGGVVGTTRQAAWERFAKRLPGADGTDVADHVAPSEAARAESRYGVVTAGR
ncbi:AsnC family protein [Nocardioides sp. GY 10127]|uniref:AsnC family protein n=1 Tax=Nocardioides sp. GY 10127 TaxID=2569762 RepID=UPI0010A87FF7|nr:AsnC family protein [Nocardioides sp. GY 10127]TIC82571.1 AsnC family protein [Nocardioides sp. GY 10127]